MNNNKQNVPFSIQKIIKKQLEKEHLTPTQLARRLNMRPISVHHMLDRSTMQVDRLWSICVALDINIFQAIANELDIEYYNPKVEQKNQEIVQQKNEMEELKNEMEELKRQLEIMKHERDTLKEVISLLKI